MMENYGISLKIDYYRNLVEIVLRPSLFFPYPFELIEFEQFYLKLTSDSEFPVIKNNKIPTFENELIAMQLNLAYRFFLHIHI